MRLEEMHKKELLAVTQGEPVFRRDEGFSGWRAQAEMSREERVIRSRWDRFYCLQDAFRDYLRGLVEDEVITLRMYKKLTAQAANIFYATKVQKVKEVFRKVRSTLRGWLKVSCHITQELFEDLMDMVNSYYNYARMRYGLR